MASPSGLLPIAAAELGDIVLPADAPVNWQDSHIDEHLYHLANAVALVHLDLVNFQAGRFLAPFCEELAQLGWSLRPVLSPEERDAWIWRILSDIASRAGLKPRTSR